MGWNIFITTSLLLFIDKLLPLKNMYLWPWLLSAFEPSLLSERFGAVGCKLLSSAIQLWEQQLAELFVALHSLNWLIMCRNAYLNDPVF